MSDLICKKDFNPCRTPGMCAPHGGCNVEILRSSTEEALANLTVKDWEIIGLKATIAQQAQMIEHLRGGLTTPTHIDVANADADGFKNGRKSVGLITGKAFTSFDKSGGRYRVTMDFQFKEDALRAYNELSQVAELAAKP